MIDISHLDAKLWPVFINTTYKTKSSTSRNYREGSVTKRHSKARMKKLMSRKRYKWLHYPGRKAIARNSYGASPSQFRRNLNLF